MPEWLPSKEKAMPDQHYRKPGWFTKHVLNQTIVALTKMGVSLRGSRTLEVRGRKSGLPRRTPVNLLNLGGRQYLVAPRGETDWVRNVRADDGKLDLLLGSRRQHYRAKELSDADKTEVLRAYLKAWKAEVGIFFDGVGPDSTDDQFRSIAHKHPVFLIEQAS
jgi:deazaflavin-dependent oxidoreductase (nitroreductase family)